MPVAKVTKVTISHIWDDNSSTDYDVGMNCNDPSGPHIVIKSGGNVINIYPESWEEIKDQITTMIDEINLDTRSGK